MSIHSRASGYFFKDFWRSSNEIDEEEVIIITSATLCDPTSVPW